MAGAGVAGLLIRGFWRPISSLSSLWWVVLVLVAEAALVGWGELSRARAALLDSLREQARRAESEQASRVAEARAAERASIAREMHDVLAHRLSLLATYAGALEYRPDAPPEQLARAAGVVRGGVHQALEELRAVIGVLRDDDAAPGVRPQPGLRRPGRAGRGVPATRARRSRWRTGRPGRGSCLTASAGPPTAWCRRD